MAMLKTLWSFALAGAIVGAVGATLIAPGFLTWYNTPGSAGQALCNCPELVRATSSQLIQAQLIGAAIGAGASLVVGVLVVRARKNKRKAPPAAPAAPSTPSAPPAP